MQENSLKYLTEAFKQLDLLDEEAFDITDDGIIELDDFENSSDNEEDNVIDVIDPEADEESDEELDEKDYVGKVILQCCVCHTMVYKPKNEVIIDSESGLANVSDECPFCYTADGFNIVGEVAPYDPDGEELKVEADDDVDVEVEPKDKENKEKNESLRRHRRMRRLQESVRRRPRRRTNEDLNNISLDTENEHITISSEPKQNDFMSDDTMIVPVDDSTENDILDNSAAENEDEEPMNEPMDFNSDEEVNADDLDTDSFDEMEESYLKKNYANVKSYKTRRVTESKDGKLTIEGIVRFKSGKSKKVKSIYESKYATRSGRVVLEGVRTQSDECGKKVILRGRLNRGSIVTESLNIKRPSKRVSRGIARR